jgi:hypothetical protein
MRLHVVRGPDVRTATGKTRVRWCFNCREHLLHEWTVFTDSEPSYYEPVGAWLCSQCDKDRTAFPGCEAA